MAYCTQCGAELDENNVCTKCAESENDKDVIEKTVEKFKNTPDDSENYEKKDIKENLVFATLSYFGILIILPFICAPDSKFAKFHANQALNLLICSFAYSVIAALVSCACFNATTVFGLFIAGIFLILSVVPFVMWIQGIANAASGKAKRLPFIGKTELIK